MDLKEFEKRLRGMVRSKEGKSVIKQNDILDHIEDSKQHLNVFRNMMENLSQDHVNELKKQTVRMAEENDYFAAKYEEMVSRLQGKAAKAENNAPFTVCHQVADKLVGMLENTRKQVDNKFPEKLNIHTSRYSHLAALGGIHACDQFSQFCIYLHQGLMWEVSQHLREPPKYRFNYVEQNFWPMVNLINKTFAGTGPATLPSVMEHLRKSNNDIPIITDEGEPNTGYFNKSKAGDTTMNLLGISLFNPFWKIGKLYTEWRHARIDKIEKERDWVQAHISLLKMDLEGADPDSSEYQRLQKIIENYEGMLAKLDKQLQEYYEED